jgi:hypothetical protein
MIQAIALTVYVDKPTANGYSGSVPKNYPSFDWYADGNLTAMGEWLAANKSLTGTCLLDGFNYEHPPRFDSDEITFIPGSGFTGIEKSSTNTWSWSVWEKSFFYIQSFKDSDINAKLIFTLEIPKCLDGAVFEIEGSGIKINTKIENSHKTEIELLLQVDRWERIPFSIQKDQGSCVVDGDPRDLHFSIKDLQVTEVN